MSTSNDSSNNASAGKCPFHTAAPTQSAGGGTANRDWWPNQLRVDLLNQHSARSNPLGESFNYADEFKKLDYDAVTDFTPRSWNRKLLPEASGL